MRIIEQSYKIIEPASEDGWENQLYKIELAARNCYQSEFHSTNKDFIRRLIVRDHLAMLEFGSMTVQFITDRGVSHEIVRHRLFSFAQESTRYCRYKNEITVIKPSTYDGWHDDAKKEWTESILRSQDAYLNMLDIGLSPQQARSVLPNALKTSLFVSGNFREWLHFFHLRDSSLAHPDMKDLIAPLHKEVGGKCPTIF